MSSEQWTGRPDRGPSEHGRAAGYRACIRALPEPYRTDRQREVLGDTPTPEPDQEENDDDD